MSILECDLHHQPAAGRLMGFFLTVIQDGVRYKRKLRLCQSCLDDLVAHYGNQWSDGFILNKFGPTSSCSSCGVERGSTGSLHPLYVTAYSASQKRFDYFATYCSDCAQTLIDTFQLSDGDSRHAA